MEKLKNEIRELLLRNLLMKKEVKRHILQKIDVLTEQQCLELIELLKKGAQETIHIFQKKIQEDPNFISKIRHVKQSMKQQGIKKVESLSKIEEENDLAELEKELLAL